MTNTPKGMEVTPHSAAPRKTPDGADLTPLGPEWIVETVYGFQYGLAVRDGRQFLCTRNADFGEEDWKILMPAGASILHAFHRFQERPDDPNRRELAECTLTMLVLYRVRQKSLTL